MRFFVTAIVLLASCFSSFSQSTFTAKYFGLTVHPKGDRTAHLQPNKLDKNAVFVRNTGLFVGYERFVYEDLISVKVIQGVMTDCSNGLASATHVGIRAGLVLSLKHDIYLGVGPTFIARESWSRFGSSYTSSGFFNETSTKKFGDVQWKFIWYGAEFEYDYKFNAKNCVSLSLTPGVPLAMIFSIGWKHWIKLPVKPEPVIYVPQ